MLVVWVCKPPDIIFKGKALHCREVNTNWFSSLFIHVMRSVHPNVCRRVGFLSQKAPKLLLLEYTQYGDLKNLVTKMKKASVRKQATQKGRPTGPVVSAKAFQRFEYHYLDLALQVGWFNPAVSSSKTIGCAQWNSVLLYIYIYNTYIFRRERGGGGTFSSGLEQLSMPTI